jgi:hypothetical protein
MSFQHSKTRGRWLRAASRTLFIGALTLPAILGSARAQAQGLTGEYYSWDPTMACPPVAEDIFTPANLDYVRIDPTVDFGNPFQLPNTTAHNFAVKWSGYIQVPTSGDYQFTTRSDDGIRLWVSPDPNTPVDTSTGADVDSWIARGEGADDAPVLVSMTAGKKYPVVIEFFECGGGNAARFRFIPPDSADGITSQIVPSSMLVPATQTDTTAPGAISDLKATNPTATGATLTFTAPGDNGATGTAVGYDIRTNTVPITDANFAQSTSVDGSYHPKAGGTQESITVPLAALQNYYIAIKTVDAAGNVSALSNVANALTPAAALDLPVFSTVKDKAVYYDDNYPTNWVNRAGAQATRDYFVGKGYTLVDANGLADFMASHISSKAPSSVVMANDIFPDTVVEDVTTNANTINDYMSNGGRIIFAGDWPFYNVGQADGTSINPQGAGAQAVLGFNAAAGTGDTLDATVLTQDGLALGMTSSWPGQRPALPADIDIQLATSKGGVAGWIKFYDKTNSGGFYRIVDQAAGVLTADELHDMQVLAEASGTYVAQTGRINGQVKDPQGNPVAGALVTLSSSVGNLSATTDANGGFSTLAKPGTYTVGGKANVNALTGPIVASGAVTLAAGQVAVIPSVTAAAPSLAPLPKPVDKAVYYDAAYPYGWIGAANGSVINDFFTAAGYAPVDAAGVADFMTQHIASKTPSVVVMSSDIYPDTIVDVSSGAVVKKNIISDYMNSGGRVIHVADWPFYNVGLADGTQLAPQPAGAGATTILGFNGAGGKGDVLDNVVPSVVGAAMGLKSTWTAQRPVIATDIDVVLDNSQGGAAGWIKFYPDNTGTGAFIRIIDTAPASLTDDELADIKTLAEFSGPIPGAGGGGPTVKLGDLNGDGNVNVQDATLSLRIAVGLLTPTDAQKAAGDVNKDGKWNVQDATLILRAAVGLGTLS